MVFTVLSTVLRSDEKEHKLKDHSISFPLAYPSQGLILAYIYNKYFSQFQSVYPYSSVKLSTPAVYVIIYCLKNLYMGCRGVTVHIIHGLVRTSVWGSRFGTGSVQQEKAKKYPKCISPGLFFIYF